MIALEATNKAMNLVVCVDNGAGYYEIDLASWNVYEAVPDNSLEEDQIRVIDESGEDYVYPASYFVTAAELECARDVAYRYVA